MRRAITASIAVLGLAVTATPAGAANGNVQTVNADEYGGGRFSPASVQIDLGEKVTWTNPAGDHNVKFEDGLFESPTTATYPWPGVVERTFPQAGNYRYYCELHGGPGGIGMSGVVTVGDVAPLPPPGGGTQNPGPGPGSPTAVQIERASVTRTRFCNRRSSRCTRPGIRFRIDLSADSRLTGVLRRRPLRGPGAPRRFGTLDFGTVEAGLRRLQFRRTKSGRRLTKGRYSLKLKAGTDTQVLRFRVVR